MKKFINEPSDVLNVSILLLAYGLPENLQTICLICHWSICDKVQACKCTLEIKYFSGSILIYRKIQETFDKSLKPESPGGTLNKHYFSLVCSIYVMILQ